MLNFLAFKVSFPGLNLFDININRVAFKIGGWSIYWYGIMIAAGFVLALVYCMSKLKSFNIDPDIFIDVMMIGTIFGITGARLYYVIFNFDQYKDNLLDIFAIWNGGLAIYGGIIGACLAAYIYSRKKKFKVLPILDIAAVCFLLGQAVGRWGNFFNQEAFGTNTLSPLGMLSNETVRFLTENQSILEESGINVVPILPVHPTFLYESLWCIIGFVLLSRYAKKIKFEGELLALYFVWYGLGRFFIESIRTDSLMVGRVRVSQLLSLVLVVVSLAVIALARRNIKYGIKFKLFEKVVKPEEEYTPQFAAVSQAMEQSTLKVFTAPDELNFEAVYTLEDDNGEQSGSDGDESEDNNEDN